MSVHMTLLVCCSFNLQLRRCVRVQPPQSAAVSVQIGPFSLWQKGIKDGWAKLAANKRRKVHACSSPLQALQASEAATTAELQPGHERSLQDLCQVGPQALAKPPADVQLHLVEPYRYLEDSVWLGGH